MHVICVEFNVIFFFKMSNHNYFCVYVSPIFWSLILHLVQNQQQIKLLIRTFNPIQILPLPCSSHGPQALNFLVFKIYGFLEGVTSLREKNTHLREKVIPCFRLSL